MTLQFSRTLTFLGDTLQVQQPVAKGAAQGAFFCLPVCTHQLETIQLQVSQDGVHSGGLLNQSRWLVLYIRETSYISHKSSLVLSVSLQLCNYASSAPGRFQVSF